MRFQIILRYPGGRAYKTDYAIDAVEALRLLRFYRRDAGYLNAEVVDLETDREIVIRRDLDTLAPRYAAAARAFHGAA